jgi:hypothetical protein
MTLELISTQRCALLHREHIGIIYWAVSKNLLERISPRVLAALAPCDFSLSSSVICAWPESQLLDEWRRLVYPDGMD